MTVYVLKLKKVKSYRSGRLFVSNQSPEVQITDSALAQTLQNTGFFDLVVTVDQTPSVFQRDPSLIGGPNCQVKLYHNSAEVSGQIEWYPADGDLGRVEGCRAGFAIMAPEDLDDVDGATYTYEGQTGLVVEDTAKDPRVLWWYPLVTEEITEREISVKWNASRTEETFKVRFVDFTLQPRPQTEEEKLRVLLDSMTIPEMKKYAEKHSIDLTGLTKKSDIIDAITAAQFPESAPAGAPEGDVDPEAEADFDEGSE